MNKTLAKKYLTSINSNKRKYVTCEDLSISFGKFPESIASDLSVFEPLIILDMSLNLKDLVPAIEKYIEEENNKNDNKNNKKTTARPILVLKSTLTYSSTSQPLKCISLCAFSGGKVK